MNTAAFHPMLVHFPVALLMVGFLFSTVGLFCKQCCKCGCSTDSGNPSCIMRAGYWLLVLGALGAVASVLSGMIFTEPMQGIMGEKRSVHQLFAIMTMSVSIVSAAIMTYYIYSAKRTRPVLIIGYILYAATMILVAITGHLGGAMVY